MESERKEVRRGRGQGRKAGKKLGGGCASHPSLLTSLSRVLPHDPLATTGGPLLSLGTWELRSSSLTVFGEGGFPRSPCDVRQVKAMYVFCYQNIREEGYQCTHTMITGLTRLGDGFQGSVSVHIIEMSNIRISVYANTHTHIDVDTHANTETVRNSDVMNNFGLCSLCVQW